MTILDEILAQKAVEVAALPKIAAAPVRPVRSLLASLQAHGPVALIAEIKRKSPSRPIIRHAFDPACMAMAYENGGAAALSVLTDGPFFGGSLADLQTAREAVSLPVLRKDFLISPQQVYEAHAAGADAVLLIAGALADGPLEQMMSACRSVGLEFLLEVHTPDEMQRAMALGAPLVGINNRDLKTFRTDLDTTRQLAEIALSAPNPPFLVSESGIATVRDRRTLEGWGIGAMLVGESLLIQEDLVQAARSLLT